MLCTNVHNNNTNVRTYERHNNNTIAISELMKVSEKDLRMSVTLICGLKSALGSIHRSHTSGSADGSMVVGGA